MNTNPQTTAQLIHDDTWLIPEFLPAGPGRMVPVNSMVIRGAEPVIVDAGAPVHRATWLDKVFGLVDPEDVRWIFLSHDDIDHVGNLDQLLDACPRATIIANMFICERMSSDKHLPLSRMRWLEPGGAIDVGDRILHAVRPPLYDSPTTRGLFDPTSGVLWAADSFACPTVEPVFRHEELPPGLVDEVFYAFNSIAFPWHEWLDPTAFGRHIDSLAALPIRAIASGHGPILTGEAIDEAFDRTRAMAGRPAAESPGQSLLDEILAAAEQDPSVTLAA